MERFATYRGVTLVEVMIAVAIISVLFLGLFAALTTAFNTTGINYSNAHLQKFAQQIMEEILADSYANLATWNNKTVTYQGMIAEITVHDFAVDTKQISIFVRVDGKDTRTFTVATLKTN